MSENENMIILAYNHSKQTFEFSQKQKTIYGLLEQQNIDTLETQLESEGIDGILVLDAINKKWYLAFAKNVGIVAQRTARRQADSIIRTGFQMPDGRRVRYNYPLEELSKSKIGDLWKSVQMKYLHSDLKGTDQVVEKTDPEIISKTGSNQSS